MPQFQEITSNGNTLFETLKSNELWRYRSLLYFLTKRDIAVRYKQAFLGIAWAMIQPVLTVLIFALFFGRFAKFPSGDAPYAIFTFLALLPWNYVASAVSRGSLSLTSSSHLISKVYFPRVLIPLSASLAGLVDYFLASLLALPLLAYYGYAVTPQMFLAFPLLTLYCLALAFSISLCLSALNIVYRDVSHALPFMIQLWMFATPILYPLSIVPVQFHGLVTLNPMVAVIETFRATFLSIPIPYHLWPTALFETLAIFAAGVWLFSKQEKTLADLL